MRTPFLLNFPRPDFHTSLVKGFIVLSTLSPESYGQLFTVRMRFADEDHQQILRDSRKTGRKAATRQEPGCVSYVPHWIEGDPSTVLIYEQYKDGEALDAHRASPHFKQYVAGGLYQLMRERSVENLTAVV